MRRVRQLTSPPNPEIHPEKGEHQESNCANMGNHAKVSGDPEW